MPLGSPELGSGLPCEWAQKHNFAEKFGAQFELEIPLFI